MIIMNTSVCEGDNGARSLRLAVSAKYDDEEVEGAIEGVGQSACACV